MIIARKNGDALLRRRYADQKSLREEALRSLRFTALSKDERQKLKLLRESFPDSDDLLLAAINPETIKQDRPDVDDVAAWQKRLDAIHHFLPKAAPC